MADINYYNINNMPIGRLVSGSPGKFRTTNSVGEQLIYKTGMNKGETKKDFSIGVAYRKDQKDVPAFIRELNSYAAKEWPNLFDAELNCQFDGFAGKITDGDSTKMNKKQKRPCDRAEYRGCWIVWYSADREPECYGVDGRIIPAKEIRTGYYVRVQASYRKNTGDTPGMFLNLHAVELSGFGPEINNRPDSREAFKNSGDVIVPEGMSAVPVQKGEADQKTDTEAPPPPMPPEVEAPSDRVLYQGVSYERSDLLKRGWTESQIAALPSA